MKKRIRQKITNRFLDLDEVLSKCFLYGGHRRYHNLIVATRYQIQHLKRRYPNIYRDTFFGGERVSWEFGGYDIGHLNSGRAR